MSTDSLDTFAVLQTAESIARQAGAILLQYYERPRQANHKSTSVDLVTEADTASEAFIVAALREAFPDHRVNGEEGGGYGPPPDQTPYHWWVDPLDGTTDFAHRFPVFAVVLALSDPDLNPILGVVYDPTRDECFKGIRGHGATLNGRPLHVTATRDLAEALVVTGFPYDRWTVEDNNTALFAHFVRRAQGVRCVGSAALDLCYVAMGRLDLFWEKKLNPWDVLAGALIVEEAGGRVTDFDGGRPAPVHLGERTLATNGLIHDEALAVFRLGDAAPLPGAQR